MAAGVPTQQPVIVSAGESHSAGECIPEEVSAVQGDGEAARPAPDTALANSKEKTPMCLVNELARYNKVGGNCSYRASDKSWYVRYLNRDCLVNRDLVYVVTTSISIYFP